MDDSTELYARLSELTKFNERQWSPLGATAFYTSVAFSVGMIILNVRYIAPLRPFMARHKNKVAVGVTALISAIPNMIINQNKSMDNINKYQKF